jgi:hypothetical protein
MGENCDLKSPPASAARGARPPHAYPMRMFPVAPGASYTGCQWIWISYRSRESWDYSAVTQFEKGEPVMHVVSAEFVSSGVSCEYQDGALTKKTIRPGSPGDLGCASTGRLKHILGLTPKENEWWELW